jgi:hypothetical protein
MSRLLRVLPLALLTLIAACGGGSGSAPAASGGSGAGGPAASGSTALAPAATISVADDRKTVQLRVGQVVDVALKADEGMDTWQVSASDPAVLTAIVNPAAAAVKGMALQTYKAVGSGTAELTATDRPACNPGQACSHLIRAFKATVVVAN